MSAENLRQNEQVFFLSQNKSLLQYFFLYSKYTLALINYFSVFSNIGQIVVDGRIYPSQSTSPAVSTPQNSPSPGQNSNLVQQQPQQSPLSQALQQPAAPVYQPPRMLPPYGQPYNQNMSINMQSNSTPNMQQQQQSNVPPNMNQNIPPNIRMK